MFLELKAGKAKMSYNISKNVYVKNERFQRIKNDGKKLKTVFTTMRRLDTVNNAIKV